MHSLPTPTALLARTIAQNPSRGVAGWSVRPVITLPIEIMPPPSTSRGSESPISPTHIQTTKKARAFSMTEVSSVKPSPYIALGAVLLLPPPTRKSRSHPGGKLSYPGWSNSVTLRSSYATPIMLRLCG